MGKKNSVRIVRYLVFMLLILLFTGSLSAAGKTYTFKKLKNDTVVKAQNSRGLTDKTKVTVTKTYKVLITVDKLNIRKSPTTSSSILGKYELGNIVDVVGKSGTYLKTSKGYIAEAYTKKLVGMFMSVPKDTIVKRSTDMKVDDRKLVPKKNYQILDSKDNMLLIKIGRIKGYINQNEILSLMDTNNNKVSIAWEYLNKKSSNEKIYNDPASSVNIKSGVLGLDVLSPTWFGVTGDPNKPSTITIEDLADKKYVTIAHNNGYEVYARLCEMNKERASIEFTDKSVRTRIINQIAKLALDYDLDGINVDYEALGTQNKDGFTNFMKELYTSLKKLNLNISVDVTRYSKASSLYSLCYDRPNLAKYSDYLILMGYDEHVSSSKEPGSVGSYNWVNESIKEILDQGVPKSKLILAVPFYLREFTAIPYDAVIFEKSGKLYNLPILSDTNKLLDSKSGNYYRCLGSEDNWYIIDNNGNKGYIKKDNVKFLAASVPASTTGGGIGATTGGGIIYSTTGGAIELVLPYDVVVVIKDSSIYKSKNELVTNKIADAAAKDYYRYLGTSGDWYLIDYKGNKVYVPKSQTSFAKAETRSIASTAVSMKTAYDKIAQNGGSIYEDETSRQSIGVYYKDELQHIVWLETSESMQWRMDLINDYDLPGTAIWSLYWTPTDDIWEVIKNSLKTSL